jgi:hypothetical protein
MTSKALSSWRRRKVRGQAGAGRPNWEGARVAACQMQALERIAPGRARARRPCPASASRGTFPICDLQRNSRELTWACPWGSRLSLPGQAGVRGESPEHRQQSASDVPSLRPVPYPHRQPVSQPQAVLSLAPLLRRCNGALLALSLRPAADYWKAAALTPCIQPGKLSRPSRIFGAQDTIPHSGSSDRQRRRAVG